MSKDTETDPCVACADQQAETKAPDFDGIHQICPRCGEFKISGTALAVMSKGLGKDKRAKLSGWLLSQNRSGEVPMVTTSNLENILARPIPPLVERATYLLQEAEHGLTSLGDRFNINEPRFLAATYSTDSNDINFLLNLLSEQDLAKSVAIGGLCEITPHGYIQLDELKQKTTPSSQGFVAMWFHKDMDNSFLDGFQTGILQAGYNPVRIDQVEHVNRIDDEIIKQLKASKFVVADFTGHRGGVYFEAGFALGFDIPVFWTCRKDHMSELHFDIRQFNCIDWETPEELSERLSNRIEAVLGPGPHKSN